MAVLIIQNFGLIKIYGIFVQKNTIIYLCGIISIYVRIKPTIRTVNGG